MLENAALVGAYEAAATAALGGLLYIAAGVSAMFGAVPITATCLFAGNACLVASTGNTVLSGTSIALTIAIDSLDKTNYKFPDDFQIIDTKKEKVGDSITNIWFYDIILE